MCAAEPVSGRLQLGIAGCRAGECRDIGQRVLRQPQVQQPLEVVEALARDRLGNLEAGGAEALQNQKKGHLSARIPVAGHLEDPSVGVVDDVVVDWPCAVASPAVVVVGSGASSPLLQAVTAKVATRRQRGSRRIGVGRLAARDRGPRTRRFVPLKPGGFGHELG